jgi:hypothetical protein
MSIGTPLAGALFAILLGPARFTAGKLTAFAVLYPENLHE